MSTPRYIIRSTGLITAVGERDQTDIGPSFAQPILGYEWSKARFRGSLALENLPFTPSPGRKRWQSGYQGVNFQSGVDMHLTSRPSQAKSGGGI